MDFLQNFLTEFILAIVMFAGGLVVTLAKRIYSHHKIRTVLRFDDDKKLDLNCFTANTGQYDENELVTLGYVFEYMAVGELRAFLRSTYKEVEMKVKMSPENYGSVSKRDLHQDLILIGGPFHNSITAKLVMDKSMKLPFYFDKDANLVYEGLHGKKVFSPELSEGETKYYENDYALIVNIENPLKKGKRILAFMGCRSIGCYGAAYYIAHFLKDIKKEVGKGDYAIVVRVAGDEEDIIDEPELVWHCPL